MVRRLIYIRSRNQITLPNELVSHLQVGEGDYLQVEIGASGKAQLAPARLAVVGSAEAQEQDEQAEEQIKTGQVKTFHDVDSFARSLEETQPQGSHPEDSIIEELTPSVESLEQMERELIAATLRATKWNRSAAAKRLGWNAARFKGKLKKYELMADLTKPRA